MKFIHTADVHIGMENYGKIDSKTGIHTRLLDFEKALNFSIDYAIENDVDFYILAGDAYKTANPSPTHQKILIGCLLRLYQKKIPVVIAVGNHDNPLSFGKTNALDIFNDFPVDGFHVFSKPEILKLETKSGPVQIVGIPWPTRNNITLSNAHLLRSATEITEKISSTVAQLITNMAGELDPKIPAILTGHLTVSSGIFSGSEKRAVYGTDPILLPSQLAINPFDYVALGHLHRYQDLNKKGYPSVVYSGSIERVDFGERKEDKGFCEVNIPEKGKATHKFIKGPMRPFIQIDIELNEEEGQTEKVLEAIKSKNIKGAIVKIVYKLPENIRDKVNLKDVQRACDTAMHLVGVIPIRQIGKRQIRAATKVEMDLPELLETYFNSKENLKSKKKIYIDKIMGLKEQIDE